MYFIRNNNSILFQQMKNSGVSRYLKVNMKQMCHCHIVNRDLIRIQ